MFHRTSSFVRWIELSQNHRSRYLVYLGDGVKIDFFRPSLLFFFWTNKHVRVCLLLLIKDDTDLSHRCQVSITTNWTDDRIHGNHDQRYRSHSPGVGCTLEACLLQLMSPLRVQLMILFTILLVVNSNHRSVLTLRGYTTGLVAMRKTQVSMAFHYILQSKLVVTK